MGPEKFGLINFAGAFVGYFGILTDYGFNLSATREISIHRDDKKKIAQIFNSVIIIKSSLFLLSSVIITILIISIPLFRGDYLTYFLSFGVVLGNVLFPVWFFQGIEKMKYITLLNFTFKFITTILIFILIIKPADYHLLIFLNSLSFILTGVVSIIIIKFVFKMAFQFPLKSEIVYQLKEGWYIFLSTIAISLYTISNTFILGLFASNTVVGYFSAADKIRSAVQNVYSTISQTIYPHVSSLFNKSMGEGFAFIRKILKNFGVISFLFSLCLLVFAKQIILVVLGERYFNSIIVLQIISFLPFLIFLSNIFGIQVMLNINMKKEFTRVIVISSLINLIASFILVPLFFHVGTAVSVLLTETIVTLYMYLMLVSKKIHIFRKVNV